jgi:hypothetical protein
LALRDWQLTKKSLQLNPKFGLTAPALAPYFGDRQPPGGSGDELGPEFTTDAPHQTALPGTSGREDQSELGWELKMLGDDFHATVRNVRDHTVARQGAVPDLDFRESPAQATLGSTTIGSQHVDLLPRTVRSVSSLFTVETLESAYRY